MALLLSPPQDKFVKEFVLSCQQRSEEPHWKYIAGHDLSHVPHGTSHSCCCPDVLGRDEQQCISRWRNILNPNLRKGPWTAEEDGMIRELVALMGPKQWAAVAERLQGRTGKQCRERCVA